MKRTLILATTGAGLALALCACTTMRETRDHIVKRTPHCQDVTVQIYFEPRSATVTKEAAAVLRAAAAQAKGCKVDAVTVLGLTDAVGAPGANLELSKARAASVTQALAATGLPAAQFDLKAGGDTGAMTTEGATPMRRRADVTLKLSAPAR